MSNPTTLALLETLGEELPLADHWGPVQPFLEAVEIDHLVVHTVGLLCASVRGTEVTGSAASSTSPPAERAYFELIERTALVDAMAGSAREFPIIDGAGERLGTLPRHVVFPEAPSPEECRFALSSGVAAGWTIQGAAKAARAELIERDRVLRSWFGGGAPARQTPKSFGTWCPSSSYDVEVYTFSSDEPGSALAVAGVFAFPKVAYAPLAYGLAAADDSDTAIARAGGECQQRLAFLWGESLPADPPAFEPTAGYHQEFYLHPPTHALLRAWLRGDHAEGALSSGKSNRNPRFIDLTPEHLLSRLRVVKAVPDGELRLAFGRGHPDLAPTLQRYGVHPIA
jgi:hypothetical protein